MEKIEKVQNGVPLLEYQHLKNKYFIISNSI